MKTRILFILLFLLTIGAQPAAAKVCLEKGIYMSTHQDMPGINDQETIFSLPLERTYNSSASQPGMFGLGWGTSYETTLSVFGDGVVIVQEGGSGRKSFYALEKTDLTALEFDQSTSMDPLNSDCSFADTAERHVSSASSEGKSKIVNGDVFKWRHGCDQGYVLKESDGYQRVFSQTSEFFDAQGRLFKVTDKKGLTVVIHRNSTDQISEINNNSGHSIAFTYSDDGFVTSAQRGDKKISYTYQAESLVMAAMRDNKQFYTYDTAKRLARTASQNTVFEEVTYDAKGRVIFLEDVDISLNVFQYLDDDSTLLEEGFHHGVLRTMYKGKKQSWQAAIFYARKTNRYGISHLSHKLEENDLGQHETLYQECGLPVSHSRSSGKYKITSQYNEDCLLVMKNDGKTIKQLSYDEKHQKINKVLVTDMRSNTTTWTNFAYDAKANLIHAITSEKLEVHLTYDRDSQIISIMDEKGQVMTFEYNDAGQPTLIAVADLGKLEVTYDEHGEVADVKVADGKGHEIAQKVVDVFQHLLHIVNPAGVEINM